MIIPIKSPNSSNNQYTLKEISTSNQNNNLSYKFKECTKDQNKNLDFSLSNDDEESASGMLLYDTNKYYYDSEESKIKYELIMGENNKNNLEFIIIEVHNGIRKNIYKKAFTFSELKIKSSSFSQTTTIKEISNLLSIYLKNKESRIVKSTKDDEYIDIFFKCVDKDFNKKEVDFRLPFYKKHHANDNNYSERIKLIQKEVVNLSKSKDLNTIKNDIFNNYNNIKYHQKILDEQNIKNKNLENRLAYLETIVPELLQKNSDLEQRVEFLERKISYTLKAEREIKKLKKLVKPILTENNNENINNCNQIATLINEEVKNKNINMMTTEKSYINTNNNVFLSNSPANLNYLTQISSNANHALYRSHLFVIFSSIKNTSFLVYSTNLFNIVFYSFKRNKIEYEIQNAHGRNILCIRHYYDKKENRDLIVSSSQDQTVKLWNFTDDLVNLATIKNKYLTYQILSVGILYDSKYKCGSIAIGMYEDCVRCFNFKGKFIKSFGEDKNHMVIDMEIYKDKEDTYLIEGGDNGLYSYNYNTGEEIFNYKKDGLQVELTCIKLFRDINEVLCVVVTEFKKKSLTIFDFFKGNLIKSIYCECYLVGLCIWNDKFIITGGEDKLIKVIEIESCCIVKTLKGHNSFILTIDKGEHPMYGECLVTSDYQGVIKLWNINDN